METLETNKMFSIIYNTSNPPPSLPPPPFHSRIPLLSTVHPRMPYFSYLSMLFFYDTLGWWNGGAEVRKVHFAEVCKNKTQKT